MSKLSIGIIASAIFIAAVILGGSQMQMVKKKDALLQNSQAEIAYLEENLDLQIKENEALEEETFLLEEHSNVLRDSVMNLQNKVSKVLTRLDKQNAYVKLVERKLKKIQSQYIALQKNLKAAPRKSEADQQKVAQLLEKQRLLLLEIDDLKAKKKWAGSLAEAPSKVIKSTSTEVTPNASKLDFLIPTTSVKILQAELKKKRFGKALKKVKNGKDWRYTLLKLDLTHPQLAQLNKRNFKVKIVNADDGSIVSYIESNPNFPNSQLDAKGVGFRYEGETIDMVYYNNSEKSGKNYELRFYAVDDHGTEHLLPAATTQIVKDRKVIF